MRPPARLNGYENERIINNQPIAVSNAFPLSAVAQAGSIVYSAGLPMVGVAPWMGLELAASPGAANLKILRTLGWTGVVALLGVLGNETSTWHPGTCDMEVPPAANATSLVLTGLAGLLRAGRPEEREAASGLVVPPLIKNVSSNGVYRPAIRGGPEMAEQKVHGAWHRVTVARATSWYTSTQRFLRRVASKGSE